MAKKANQAASGPTPARHRQLAEARQRTEAEVDKSNENTLSLDVLKKAEEIEKLAHSVKEKMKAN